jgi:hypothetical protein
MCTKHMEVQLIDVDNKTSYLGSSWALPNDLRHNEAGFSMISTDSLCIRVAQMPRSRDLVIFVLTTDDRQTHKPIALRNPAAHERTRDNHASIHVFGQAYKLPPFPSLR